MCKQMQLQTKLAAESEAELHFNPCLISSGLSFI